MITNLINAYIGDSSVSRLYQGDQLIYDSGHPDILCEYLQAGADGVDARGGVYFDTGYTPSYNSGLEIKWQLPQNNSLVTGSYEAFLYGMSQNTSSGASFSGDHYFMSPAPYNGTILGRWRSLSIVRDTHAPDSSIYTACITCNGTAQTVKVSNGFDSSTTASSSKAFEYSSYIFAGHLSGGAGTYALSGTRIYYLKILGNRNNNIIRFYVPVLHWNGSAYVPCFLDKVNNKYIYNQGSGTVYYKIKDDYVLNYLANGPDNAEGTPNVYFDTGYTPQLSTATYIKFEMATVKGGRLFGCGNGSNAATQYWVNTYTGGNTPSGTGTSIKFACRGQNITAPFTPQANTSYKVTFYLTSSGNSASAINMNVNGTDYSRSVTISLNISSASSAYILGTNGATPAGPNLDPGVKIYFVNMSNNNFTVRNYIPVLHNNQACFLDLNSNTYIYNLGTDTPSYSF